MVQPGRNPDGTFASNDATVGQFAEAIVAAVEVLRRGVWLHTEQQREYEGHIATARAAARLTDAGERPGKEDTH